MADERYPHDLEISLDDFRRCGWREVLGGIERKGYSAMWQSFSSAARRAIEEDRKAEGKVLWLLADACSMMLHPPSPNDPFRPMIVIEGKRSALPEDFGQNDIEFFGQIVEEIDAPWLQARLSDLVWLVKQPRDPRFALTAIDAYRRIPLDTDTWIRDGGKCWERAVRLGIMLAKGAGDRLREMEESLFSALKSARPEDGFLALWLAELMMETGLGRSRQIEIANKLEELAIHFDEDGELHRAREYCDAATKWYGKVEDDQKVAEMTVRLAETWVKEAIARMSTDTPSYMVGAMFLENAIHAYRRIPRKIRPNFKADERIQELYRQKRKAGEKSLDEMGVITSPSIDITELVENAKQAVSGKQLTDALSAFANIYQGIRVDRLRSSAIDLLRNHPLQALFPATVISRDGRVIAKRPAMGVGHEDNPENEEVIWAEMIKHYSLEIGLVVQGTIWPALETLLLEHRLTERDFVAVSARSPVVPYGREGIVGKGLFAGFEKDFATATHLLVPQIEHMVRWHLKSRGVKTTVLDANGIENEVGLSSLLDMAEVNDIFGKDLTFELKALFADPFGPNLRNEVAHGLLEYDAAQSVYAIYAWWFFFRLVFKTFLNRASSERNSAKHSGEMESETQAK
ncbi:MAG: DUF4209 domain-containing protein [Deltaproteobacteria bacterium]|nr:DUF4209 domain-containing protein [Deltaproteobacteria bacterium]